MLRTLEIVSMRSDYFTVNCENRFLVNTKKLGKLPYELTLFCPNVLSEETQCIFHTWLFYGPSKKSTHSAEAKMCNPW